MTALLQCSLPEVAPLRTSDAVVAARAAVVRLTAVGKSYQRGTSSTRVLNGCSMTVQRGECVYLLGPSGSGKTTLLSIIGCLLRADEGSVEILGRDASRMSPAGAAELRRNHLGFVFQRFHLIRGLSALENVCMPLTLAGAAPRAAQQRGRELLEQVGLAKHIASDPRRMSVGQCQRVALARALAANPALILADEPTAALDAAAGQQAMQLLRRLTVEAGKTVIVVTHDSRILSYADRVFLLEGGCVTERSPHQQEASRSL